MHRHKICIYATYTEDKEKTMKNIMLIILGILVVGCCVVFAQNNNVGKTIAREVLLK